MTETFFSTASIKLHGARLGTGPLVIYLHGITANWAVWEPVMALMAGKTTGITISQRGHGQSDKPATEYGADGYVSDVIALIEAVNIGPAYIVGHSLGARNAVVAGARRPDLVRGVLSVDFVPYCETSALDLLAERVNKGARGYANLDEVKAYLADRYKLLPADAIARRALNGFHMVDGLLHPWADPAAMAATAQGLYENYEDEYRSVAVPMIAVRGEHSTLVSPGAYAQGRALRPDIEHAQVTEVDHYVPEESPTAIAALIDKLMALAQASDGHASGAAAKN